MSSKKAELAVERAERAEMEVGRLEVPAGVRCPAPRGLGTGPALLGIRGGGFSEGGGCGWVFGLGALK